VTLLLPAHPFEPFGDQRTFLVPSGPAEIEARACGKQQVDLVCNGEQGGPKITCAIQPALSSADLSPPRPRFARSRILPAFSPHFAKRGQENLIRGLRA
jgi:hypothetical protein